LSDDVSTGVVAAGVVEPVEADPPVVVTPAVDSATPFPVLDDPVLVDPVEAVEPVVVVVAPAVDAVVVEPAVEDVLAAGVLTGGFVFISDSSSLLGLHPAAKPATTIGMETHFMDPPIMKPRRTGRAETRTL
jgi:hypothetical protein